MSRGIFRYQIAVVFVRVVCERKIDECRECHHRGGKLLSASQSQQFVNIAEETQRSLPQFDVLTLLKERVILA